MRKSLLLFCACLAGLILFLFGLSEAIHFAPLIKHQPRLIALRGFLSIAGGLFFSGWALRFLPEPARTRIQALLQRIASPIYRVLYSPRIGLVVTLLMLALLSFFSVWYASLGLFPRFPKFGNMYIDQAKAFLNGSISLGEASPQLLALPDPYDFQARKTVRYMWDGSLYEGKYYLYWGPVPAILFAAIMAVVGDSVPDPLLVILSAIAILVVLLLLMRQIRKRVYPQAPVISIGLFLFAAIFNLPYLFMLGRAHVYETSIISGQLFILLGLASCFAYTQSKKNRLLWISGLCWGLAIACRYTLAISVLVFGLFLLWMIWQTAGTWRALVIKAAYLAAPLAVCVLGMGIYNWMRFDSPLETGLKYQLTPSVYQKVHFSPAYLRTNFYVNVWYTYSTLDYFPFLHAVDAAPDTAPAWVQYHPGKQTDDAIFGLRVVPLFWFLALLLAVSFGLKWIERVQHHPPETPLVFGWQAFAWMVGLAGLGQFVLLQFYYYSAVRFMADFYLSWMLVLLFLLWSLDRRLVRAPLPRTALWITTGLVILATALLAFLAGFDNPPQVFLQFNPLLEGRIATLWNALYTAPTVFGKALHYFMLLIL